MGDTVENVKPGREIATSADGQDIIRGFVVPIMPNTDSVLISRGGGDLQLDEEVKRDDQVKATFEAAATGYGVQGGSGRWSQEAKSALTAWRTSSSKNSWRQ